MGHDLTTEQQQMLSDAEHIFMYLLDICIFFPEKCLFISFALLIFESGCLDFFKILISHYQYDL